MLTGAVPPLVGAGLPGEASDFLGLGDGEGDGVCSGDVDGAAAASSDSGDGDSASAGDCSGVSDGEGSGVSDRVGEGFGDGDAVGRGECDDFGRGDALERGVGVGECFLELVVELDFFFFFGVGPGVGVPVIKFFTLPMNVSDADLASPARATNKTVSRSSFDKRLMIFSQQVPAGQLYSSARPPPDFQSESSR
jgi:hypothetical protein